MMLTFMEHIGVLCFAGSFAVAFVLELGHFFWARPILRLFSLGFGIAGVFAQGVYLVMQMHSLPLGSPSGSLLFLAFVLAVFYLSETLHHRRVPWALFVLPLILALIGLATILREPENVSTLSNGWTYFWGTLHGTLLLLAAVGVCVGFISSIMYFVQLHRLRAKLPPNRGMPMFSLERLEQMNRRALLAAFPLLTAGLLVGLALQLHTGSLFQGWDSLKIVSVLGLWLVFAILLYLRYRVHVRGRQLALLTMLAFAIMVVALVSPPHSFVPGTVP